MAKSNGKGGGPGTTVRGSVRTTMYPPFEGGANKGSQVNMTGTFDKPRSGGDNGMATTVTATMPMKKAPKSTPTMVRNTPGTIET